MSNGEIPSFPVRYEVCARNRSEAIRDNIGKESECSNTTATENSDKNICLRLHQTPLLFLRL